MGVLTVKFQDRDLLRFNTTQWTISAVKAEVHALAMNMSDVRQFVQAHMFDLISGKDPRTEMLACVIYRVLLEPFPHPPATIGDLLPLGNNYAVSIVPDVDHVDGYHLVVEA